jgi:hypothetical protein
MCYCDTFKIPKDFIKKFHKEVGVLVEGDIWDRDFKDFNQSKGGKGHTQK